MKKTRRPINAENRTKGISGAKKNAVGQTENQAEIKKRERVERNKSRIGLQKKQKIRRKGKV